MKYYKSRRFLLGLTILFVAIAIFAIWEEPRPVASGGAVKVGVDSTWVAPDIASDKSLSPETRQLLLYGQDLIANTAKYFGPKGSIAHTSNGMNCQNCHLEAGSKSWGNNFGAVAANYPRFNARGGSIQSIYGRINDCFQRSLNGSAVDTTTREMHAMFAYIHWLGKDVPQGKKPYGSGTEKIPFLNRAASPDSGRLVYAAKCMVCHGKNGLGLMAASGLEYVYPPLWGRDSYNSGAGLHRLSNFAGFVKSNMPYLQTKHAAPLLTTSQAWDVAAFVNSQPRPTFDQHNDWAKDISKKPFDCPAGPYADSFPQQQHKYGPFAQIVAAKRK